MGLGSTMSRTPTSFLPEPPNTSGYPYVRQWPRHASKGPVLAAHLAGDNSISAETARLLVQSFLSRWNINPIDLQPLMPDPGIIQTEAADAHSFTHRHCPASHLAQCSRFQLLSTRNLAVSLPQVTVTLTETLVARNYRFFSSSRM